MSRSSDGNWLSKVGLVRRLLRQRYRMGWKSGGKVVARREASPGPAHSTGIPNGPRLYQMGRGYTKWAACIPNGPPSVVWPLHRPCTLALRLLPRADASPSPRNEKHTYPAAFGCFQHGHASTVLEQQCICAGSIHSSGIYPLLPRPQPCASVMGWLPCI